MENFTYFAASDIHGNIQALDEIIRLAKKEKADRLFIAGDLCPGDPSFALRLSLRGISARGIHLSP